MADGELFAAMHDVGLAEFVAKGRRSSNLASLADVNTQKTLFQIQEEGDGGARRGSVGGAAGTTEVKGGGGGCCIIA